MPGPISRSSRSLIATGRPRTPPIRSSSRTSPPSDPPSPPTSRSYPNLQGRVPHPPPGANTLDMALVDRAIALRLRGLGPSAVGKAVGRTAPTVRQWFARFPERVDAAIRATEDDPRQITRPLVPLAADRYGEALSSGPLAIAAFVAKDVLDRHYGKPVQRQAVDVRQRVEIVFTDRSTGLPTEFDEAEDEVEPELLRPPS